MPARLYHNPRCSKSRAALALLSERGVDVEVVEYLKTPPSADDVRELLVGLGGRPGDLLRTKEPLCAELGLGPESSEDEVVEAIAAHPELLERPVLVVGSRAAIGRPTENLLPLLD